MLLLYFKMSVCPGFIDNERWECDWLFSAGPDLLQLLWMQREACQGGPVSLWTWQKQWLRKWLQLQNLNEQESIEIPASNKRSNELFVPLPIIFVVNAINLNQSKMLCWRKCPAALACPSWLASYLDGLFNLWQHPECWLVKLVLMWTLHCACRIPPPRSIASGDICFQTSKHQTNKTSKDRWICRIIEYCTV